jgi:hypothetical protein
MVMVLQLKYLSRQELRQQALVDASVLRQLFR